MTTTVYFNETKDFTRLSDCTEKVELALYRLEYPVGITEDALLMYQDYLFKNGPSCVTQFIDMNRLHILPLLVKYRVIRKANVLKFTEYAQEARKMDILSYLMDVGNRLRNRPKSPDIAQKYSRGKAEFIKDFTADYSTAKAGEIIWLGKVPMPWKVLENKDGRLFLLSVYVLDCLPFEDFYDPLYYSMSYDRTRWPFSSLRRRINSTFLDSLLSDEEKSRVIPVYISADDTLAFEMHEGEKKDSMFLLSKSETEKYLRTKKDRLAPITSFATSSKLYNDFVDYGYWWLRTPGRYAPEKMYVIDGDITSSNSIVGGDHFNFFGVRPAMYYNAK